MKRASKNPPIPKKKKPKYQILYELLRKGLILKITSKMFRFNYIFYKRITIV